MTPGATSRSAYYGHATSGRARSQRERILEVYRSEYPYSLSRAQVAAVFSRGGTFANGKHLIGLGKSIPLASVCGRVNALIANGDLEVDHEAPDIETGHTVEYLRWVPPGPRQGKLGI